MTIGEILRKARTDKGLTLKQTEDKTGITEVTLSRYENNHRQPSFLNMAKLANQYNLSLDLISKQIDYYKKE